MTKTTFDIVIHAPNRLQICALLDTTKELEFQIIKEQLDVSDSVLSKHLKVLEDANYVQLIKKDRIYSPTNLGFINDFRKNSS
jgi:DNA-binding transcriptional ArsR family regulator